MALALWVGHVTTKYHFAPETRKQFEEGERQSRLALEQKPAMLTNPIEWHLEICNACDSC
jgi:hypothetical protein